MRLTLGPLQYFWSRQRVLAFYREAAGWPVDVIYLGETVCSKRRELTTRDWIALAEELLASDREIVLSSLALTEAESELSALTRLVGDGRFRVEANDMSAVQLLRERGLPFVGGPTLNVYNHAALRLLIEDGLQRWVLGVEQGRAEIEGFRASDVVLPELEVIAWGRLPLAFSARCFTARALDLAKDECGFRCIDYPNGLPLQTREGAAFLTLNGVQVQSAGRCDLGPELDELQAVGVDLLRLYPQAEGMAEVVARFRCALDSGVAPPRAGEENGYWRGTAGMRCVDQ
ncbi:MAG: U32 family peptidase [Gammaproteobacteria bacterium]|nr:U32 family peptidase [Gammaproteobacteria bacterium]